MICVQYDDDDDDNDDSYDYIIKCMLSKAIRRCCIIIHLLGYCVHSFKPGRSYWHGLRDSYQSVDRRGHSTETALFTMQSDSGEALDEGSVTALIIPRPLM